MSVVLVGGWSAEDQNEKSVLISIEATCPSYYGSSTGTIWRLNPILPTHPLSLIVHVEYVEGMPNMTTIIGSSTSWINAGERDSGATRAPKKTSS